MTPRIEHNFTFGDDTITEHLDYEKTASIIATSAGRAIGLLIAKSTTCGGLLYDCFSKIKCPIFKKKNDMNTNYRPVSSLSVFL